MKDRRFTATGPLTTWATARLNNYLAETLAPRVTITEPNEAGTWPRPLDEYVPSDIVDFVLADGATRVERIVEQVTYSDEDQTGLRWTVDGGSAEPFISPASAGSALSGYTPKAYGEGLRVVGTAVAAILEEFRFSEDPDETGLPLTMSGGILPAFTIRVAASDARSESKDAADILCYGSDDTFQLVQADDIITDLGFGDIVISEGNFYIGTNYTQPSGRRLRGLGPNNTVLVVDGADLTFNGDTADFAIREIDPCA